MKQANQFNAGAQRASLMSNGTFSASFHVNSISDVWIAPPECSSSIALLLKANKGVAKGEVMVHIDRDQIPNVIRQLQKAARMERRPEYGFVS